MIKNITPSQKNIILFTVAAVSVLFVSWLFIYLPAQGKINQLKADLSSANIQIGQIEAIVSQNKSIDEGIKWLEEKSKLLDSKFSRREEGALKALPDIARRFDVEIISTKSQPKTQFVDADGKAVTMEGKNCSTLLVSMEIKCNYKELVDYLEALKKDLPAYFTVGNMRINKEFSGVTRLKINLDLNLYLLS